jgi:hypothetical protein
MAHENKVEVDSGGVMRRRGREGASARAKRQHSVAGGANHKHPLARQVPAPSFPSDDGSSSRGSSDDGTVRAVWQSLR